MYILSTAHATANFFTKVVKSIFNGKGTDDHVNAVSIPSHEMPHLPFMNTRQKIAAFPYGMPRKRIKTQVLQGRKSFFKKLLLELIIYAQSVLCTGF